MQGGMPTVFGTVNRRPRRQQKLCYPSAAILCRNEQRGLQMQGAGGSGGWAGGANKQAWPGAAC